MDRDESTCMRRAFEWWGMAEEEARRRRDASLEEGRSRVKEAEGGKLEEEAGTNMWEH